MFDRDVFAHRRAKNRYASELVNLTGQEFSVYEDFSGAIISFPPVQAELPSIPKNSSLSLSLSRRGCDATLKTVLGITRAIPKWNLGTIRATPNRSRQTLRTNRPRLIPLVRNYQWRTSQKTWAAPSARFT